MFLLSWLVLNTGNHFFLPTRTWDFARHMCDSYMNRKDEHKIKHYALPGLLKIPWKFFLFIPPTSSFGCIQRLMRPKSRVVQCIEVGVPFEWLKMFSSQSPVRAFQRGFCGECLAIEPHWDSVTVSLKVSICPGCAEKQKASKTGRWSYFFHFPKIYHNGVHCLDCSGKQWRRFCRFAGRVLHIIVVVVVFARVEMLFTFISITWLFFFFSSFFLQRNEKPAPMCTTWLRLSYKLHFPLSFPIACYKIPASRIVILVRALWT